MGPVGRGQALVAFLIHVLYNHYTMTTPDEPRKLTAMRLRPSVHRQAKIAAVTAGKTLGAWIEEAVQEKIERENPHERRE